MTGAARARRRPGGADRSGAGPVLLTDRCRRESCRRATSAPVATRSTGPEPGLRPRPDRSAEGDAPAAILDDPSDFRPRRPDHRGDRLPWLALADDLPKE